MKGIKITVIGLMLASSLQAASIFDVIGFIKKLVGSYDIATSFENKHPHVGDFICTRCKKEMGLGVVSGTIIGAAYLATMNKGDITEFRKMLDEGVQLLSGNDEAAVENFTIETIKKLKISCTECKASQENLMLLKDYLLAQNPNVS